jgi:hypothetical protein
MLSNARALAEDSLRSQALALDFSTAIQQCEFSTFSGGGSNSELLTAVLGDAIGKEIPSRSLTPGEERRLGIWKTPNGACGMLFDLVSYSTEYYGKHGTLPPTGMDFFPELSTDEGLRELLTMDPLKAVTLYRVGIDPITGHFYANLQSADWASAAVNLRMSDDPAVVERALPNVRHRRMSWGGPGQQPRETGELDKPGKVWWVTIYGEAPGSVIYQETLASS